MDQDEITLPCYRCSKQFPIMQMVMDESQDRMACRPCAGVDEPRKQVERPKKRGQYYICKDCDYKFRSTRPIDQAVCGYCGSKQLATEKEAGADALLREVTDERH